eukprot:jgi/Botrbrau1/17315/Bobra.0015s0064.2
MTASRSGPKDLFGKMTESGDVEIDLKAAPKELQELVRLAQQSKAGSGLAAGEDIVPTPGFVIKTADANGSKFFINVCMSTKIAAPGTWTQGQVPEHVKEALEKLGNEEEGDAESLRFPLSLGEARPDQDHKGDLCTSVDCIFNEDVVKQAQSYRPLKRFLIEMTLRWVEEKLGVKLDPHFKLPKMRYKGLMVQSQTVKIDRKPLVQEVRDLPEEPVFALPLNKKAATAATAASPAGSAAATRPTASSNSSSAAATAPTTGRSGAKAAPKKANAPFSFDGKSAEPQRPPAGESLTHEVEYEGAPAVAALLQVRLPSNGAQISASDVRLEVRGTSATVHVPGHAPLEVQASFEAEKWLLWTRFLSLSLPKAAMPF